MTAYTTGLINKGREQGIEQGRKEERIISIINLLRCGCTEEMCRNCGYSDEEIVQAKAKHKIND